MTFADIENSLNLSHWRPYYKMASYNVHAGAKGIHFSLSLWDSSDEIMVVAGANTGFIDPMHGTAISLTQLTSTLLAHKPTLDSTVWTTVLQTMAGDVAFAAASKQDRLDEMEQSLRDKK